MKHLIVLILLIIFSTNIENAYSQPDPDSLQKTPDVIGGIYDRPYISQLGNKIAIGGYAEINSNFHREEGIEEGLSFEARRFNLFFYSPISARVKLTSELEFEHGTEEIALETALVDILFSTTLNLRMGILLSPLGRFNIAHDSPRYDIIDRPLVSTQIIPSTLSEVGLGLFGAFYATPFDRFTYEIYTVNGLSSGVVGGSGEGTRISAGKSSESFGEDNNGSPAFTGRLAFNPSFGGELGLSFHSGYYNDYKIEGEPVDDKRRLTILALDFEYKWKRFHFRGEAANAKIDVPASLGELFADKQKGFYGEVGYTFLKGEIFNMPDASLTLVSRYDAVDLNDGSFAFTGQNIGDSAKKLTIGLSFRPTVETSVRLNYARNWQRDAFNNLTNGMNIQLGVATYF